MCQFTSLTFLELPAIGHSPQLLLELTQRLPHLQRLVLNDVSGEQCELLPRLADLSALSSLSLSTSHHTAGLPLAPLLGLLSDASCRLRQLSLTAQFGFDRHLPLAMLSGLESLSLNAAEVQVRGCALEVCERFVFQLTPVLLLTLVTHLGWLPPVHLLLLPPARLHPSYAADPMPVPVACSPIQSFVQLEPPSCVTSLTRLTELKLNVGALLQQASDQRCTAGRHAHQRQQALHVASAWHWFAL